MTTRDDQETNRKTGLAYSAGLMLFACVVAFSGLGWLMDRWLGTRPWLLVAGLVVGSIAGFVQFLRLAAQTY